MRLTKYNCIAATCVLSAAAFASVGAFGQGSQFVSCPETIAHCVHSVSGWCEKEPNGKIMIVYYDKSTAAERYRLCINEVAAKRARTNQKPAPAR